MFEYSLHVQFKRLIMFYDYEISEQEKRTEEEVDFSPSTYLPDQIGYSDLAQRENTEQ